MSCSGSSGCGWTRRHSRTRCWRRSDRSGRDSRSRYACRRSGRHRRGGLCHSRSSGCWRCHRRRSRFRRRFLRRRSLGGLLGFGRFFGCRHIAEVLAHSFGVHEIDRARVRFLFGDACFWEVLDQDFRLDLEFSSQFVDPDLIGICHSPLV
jgi:hypothetical protein